MKKQEDLEKIKCTKVKFYIGDVRDNQSVDEASTVDVDYISCCSSKTRNLH